MYMCFKCTMYVKGGETLKEKKFSLYDLKKNTLIIRDTGFSR